METKHTVKKQVVRTAFEEVEISLPTYITHNDLGIEKFVRIFIDGNAAPERQVRRDEISLFYGEAAFMSFNIGFDALPETYTVITSEQYGEALSKIITAVEGVVNAIAPQKFYQTGHLRPGNRSAE